MLRVLSFDGVLLLIAKAYEFKAGGTQKLYKNANLPCNVIFGILCVYPEISPTSDP